VVAVRTHSVAVDDLNTDPSNSAGLITRRSPDRNWSLLYLFSFKSASTSRPAGCYLFEVLCGVWRIKPVKITQNIVVVVGSIYFNDSHSSTLTCHVPTNLDVTSRRTAAMKDRENICGSYLFGLFLIA
jgi:hypothetical protein